MIIKNSNNLIALGLICISLSINLRHFIDSSALTEFISGFLIGIGICFEFAGMLKIRKNKKKEGGM